MQPVSGSSGVRGPSFRNHRAVSEHTSQWGRRNRRANTAPELLLRKALWALGARYRLHPSDLPGKPDLVFRSRRVAVFCDGDFWHGRNWEERRRRLERGSNAEYWTAKIQRNRARDAEVDAQLREMGWRVVRVWESDIRRDANAVARSIAGLLSSS